MKPRTQVLVVDDELDQLESLCRGLFLLGFDVVGARSAAEALEHLEGPRGAQFDVLLTDLTMPGMSGAQLVERARALRPCFPVLVIAGLALSPEVQAIRARGIPLLRKPFTPAQLGRALETLLSVP